MVDDVLVNKCEGIEKCIKRIHEIYQKNLFEDQLRQDAILLNIERMCQATIDAATRLVRLKKIGIPKDSRDSFEFLFKDKIIDAALNDSLKKMVGFRNIAVHDYQTLDLTRVQKVIEADFSDIRKFVKVCIKFKI